PATDCNASPETCPPGGKSPASWLPSRPASCPRSCEHVTVTSSAPSSSKTGPSRRDADDSFTSDPQAMPPPPTAKPFRSTNVLCSGHITHDNVVRRRMSVGIQPDQCDKHKPTGAAEAHRGKRISIFRLRFLVIKGAAYHVG